MTTWILLIFVWRTGSLAVPIDYRSKESCEAAFTLEVLPKMQTGEIRSTYYDHVCMEKPQ